MGESRFNGKTGDMLRWALGLVLTAVVGYFVAQGAIQTEIAAIKARQDSQFSEVLRRLDILQDDVRELRRIP